MVCFTDLCLAVYMNFGIQVKLHLDWEKKPTGHKHNCTYLLGKFDTMALPSKFAHLTSDDFTRVSVASQSLKTKKTGHVLLNDDEDYMSMGDSD